MSMHSNIVKDFRTGPIEPVKTDQVLAGGAFHFAIDGQEFLAIESELWRKKKRRTVDGVALAETVIGRIVTPNAQYVILGDEPREDADARLTEILSRRELEVAVLIADGQCDKEIARQLGISIYTVREHIRRIFAKLNVSRRGGVIARVLKR